MSPIPSQTSPTQQVIGFIPARGGSKGFPGKNIKLLNGKPLLAYTIEAALDSRVLDQVIVSSDADSILDVATEYGAKTEQRDPKLCDDQSLMDDVLQDFIERMAFSDDSIVVLLQPTAPLRKSSHVREALSWFEENSGDGVISVKQLDSTVLYAYVEDQQYLAPISSLRDNYPHRQDLPVVYCPNGAITIFSVATFKQKNSIPKSKLVPFVMPEDESVDVNTEEDLRRCSRNLMGLPERRKHY